MAASGGCEYCLICTSNRTKRWPCVRITVRIIRSLQIWSPIPCYPLPVLSGVYQFGMRYPATRYRLIIAPEGNGFVVP